MPSRSFRLALLVLSVAGCGGQSAGDATHTDASGGTGAPPARGGQAQAGASGATSAGGNEGGETSAGGTGAKPGSGGSSGDAQCAAVPTCGPEEAPLKPGSSCPEGNVCREVTLCGSTILCTAGPRCEAYPACDFGDTRIEGACPPDASCYTRSLCGNGITCRVQEPDVGGAAGAGGANGRECLAGFVPCEQASQICVKILPDSDEDGCCACLMP